MWAAVGGAVMIVLSALGTMLYLTKTFRTVFADLDEAYRGLFEERNKRALSDANLMRAGDNLLVVQKAYEELQNQLKREVQSRKQIEEQRNAFMAEINELAVPGRATNIINDILRNLSKNRNPAP